MILTRQFENEYGTFGELKLKDNIILKTLELKYKSNKKSISCVPLGDYELATHNSTRHGLTVALINPDLAVHQFRARNSEGRSAILFHSANTADELEGCIAVGLDIGIVYNKWAIIHSDMAMGIFREHMTIDKRLTIK